MKRFGLTGAFHAAVFLVTFSVHAATFHGLLWQGVPLSAENVSIVPDGPPDAEFDTPIINFDSNVNGYTTAEFLNNPVFSQTSPTFDPTRTFNDSFILFTGQIFLHAGANYFEIAHDDGVIVTVDNMEVFSVPGESPATPTGFEITV